MKATIAVFAGSKDVPDSKRKELDAFLDAFFRAVSGNVGGILYGGGKYGVMGRVYEGSKEHGIAITGYSLNKYRKADSDTDTEFFETDDERIEGFYRNGDLFLALPGGF
jgi:predicted Rossmann-fold nucleotide-binding protein